LQLVKIFSRIFRTSEDKMLQHLEQGDVAETIAQFFESSTAVQPAPKAVAVNPTTSELTTTTPASK
jgi:hypothetical protein